TSIGPPIERVALEFLALMSVFARAPIVPLGLRRANDTPIVATPYYYYPQPTDLVPATPDYGFNSPEFISLLKGFAKAPEETAQAILGALKFYQSGISLIALDSSLAYTSLVSAIECIAGFHYYDRQYNFEELPKFEGTGRILQQIAKLPRTELLIAELKANL